MRDGRPRLQVSQGNGVSPYGCSQLGDTSIMIGHRGVAQRLARHVRDVEAGGSNPLTPTSHKSRHNE